MEQKYRTTLAAVAFIDVLGSSKAIKNNANGDVGKLFTG